MDEKELKHQFNHEEIPRNHDDSLIQALHKTIRFAVRILAVLMVFVILWGIGDVLYVLIQRLISPPRFLLTITDILATFGAFMAVLIAIEIFLNITVYLRKDILPVKLVVATALMAVARKAIVFDFKVLEPAYVYATSAVLLSLGITYWLVANSEKTKR